MSRTSLKQQLMREQMVQQERKEALLRQQQLQKMQTNSRLTSDHLNIGSSLINNNGNLNSNNNNNNNIGSYTSSVIAIAGGGTGSEHRGGRSIPHSIGTMKLSEAASCPSFFTDGFNSSDSGPHSSSNLPTGGSSSSSSTLITNISTTTATSSNTPSSKANLHHHHHHHHHSTLMGGNTNGSGPQSPFPLSPDSPLSGPRSSASEIDEYWEDVQRTLVLEMPDLMDQNGGGGNDAGDPMGSEHVASNSINVIHHHSHHHQSSSHHSPMDPIASTLPADISYGFNPHQMYTEEEDSLQSTSHLSDVTKMSSSCPPLSTSCPPLSSDPEFSAWERERKKKDAHNKIERRRRYNINDRIKELSTLLPTQDETYYDLVKDMKQNKGTILKASVDFVRELKRDVSRIPELEQKARELEMENRKMSMKLQQLEQDLRTRPSISEEQHGLYKPDSSSPKSIQFGHQPHLHHHAHHIHHSTHHGTPTPPPHPQSLPHHLSHGFHQSTTETDYWINSGITLDENPNTGSLQSHSQHLTSSSLGHHIDISGDLVDSIYGTSRMPSSHHHPIIKQEYNVSPSQSSSGLGSLSSPTSLGSSFLPLSQMLINEASKDSLGINSSHVKGELPSPQVMDVCD